jgi:FixJ family two-component response regulator
MPGTPLISVVDDDDAIRISLESLIRSVGMRAQGFPSAEAFLRSNQAHETDCLILDVHIPGISGLELQHQLAATDSPIPIIFVTAHENENWRSQALHAGAVAFLYKPFYEEALLNAIGIALKDA